jgi:N-acetyl-gamma-glutamyl-phosphate reductase
MMYESSSAAVGVLGATGYTGRELLRILGNHPRVRIAFATSESEAGTPLHRLTRRGDGGVSLVRAEDAPLTEAAVVFSCLPHGASRQWVKRVRDAGVSAIDLSADLRVPAVGGESWAGEAVYGLPELHRERIRGAKLVANPGCYPTAAILSLAPLVRRGLVGDGAVIINAASGVTGAGRSPKRELLFAEVADDYRAYAVGNVHRHLAEMRHQVGLLSPNGAPELVFTPHLLPVPRGILETIYVPLKRSLSTEEARAIYAEDYAGEPFVDVMSEPPTLAQVNGTNRLALAPVTLADVTAPLLMVLAAEDNLVKGAAGQAVQNLNLMFGWPETEGLT